MCIFNEKYRNRCKTMENQQDVKEGTKSKQGKQDKPTWSDMFYGIMNSWKRFKFFDGIVDHGMPNYVKAITKLSKVK